MDAVVLVVTVLGAGVTTLRAGIGLFIVLFKAVSGFMPKEDLYRWVLLKLDFLGA